MAAKALNALIVVKLRIGIRFNRSQGTPLLTYTTPVADRILNGREVAEKLQAMRCEYSNKRPFNFPPVSCGFFEI